MLAAFFLLSSMISIIPFQLPNIFKDKRCQQFEHLQEDRFQQEVRQFKQQGGGGNILSGIGNLFRGR
jgi:hypothetical protein